MGYLRTCAEIAVVVVLLVRIVTMAAISMQRPGCRPGLADYINHQVTGSLVNNAGTLHADRSRLQMLRGTLPFPLFPIAKGDLDHDSAHVDRPQPLLRHTFGPMFASYRRWIELSVEWSSLTFVDT
jgi:hypothetical protein